MLNLVWFQPGLEGKLLRRFNFSMLDYVQRLVANIVNVEFLFF